MTHRPMTVSVLLGLLALSPTVATEPAREILQAAGVPGGLIVHLGCGDGRLTAALGADRQYLVHGLDGDPDAVAKTRAHLQQLGLYGRVSVDTLDGPTLPYANNLVNLLLVEDAGLVSMAECLRVLAPKGVAYVRSGDQWQKTVKPWPDTLDEWTHHLHDAGGNAVAQDRIVGPPRHLQWTAGPLWARSHGWTPSVSAMVSAGGRMFYICDETLTGVDNTVPSHWSLVARDAFSGVLLWERPVPNWGAEAFSGTPNTGGKGVVGRFTMPPDVGKRLVAVGDTVYVTLGADAPVTALDAATGRTKRVYPETAGTDEILWVNGRLIVSLNPSVKEKGPFYFSDEQPGKSGQEQAGNVASLLAKHVCAVDAASGRVLWKKGPFTALRTGILQDPFGRLELAAGDGRVFLLTAGPQGRFAPGTIECLDLDSGDRLWQIDRPPLPQGAVTKLGYAGMYEYRLTVLVYHDGVVLLAQPEPNTHHTYHTMPGSLYAFDAGTGRQMWKHAYGAWGHCTPPDVFVVGDLVWTHVYAETEFGSVWGNGYRALDSSIVDYRIQALGLRTGALEREIRTKDIFNVGHHHRCYRNKITEQFLLSSRRGVEFVDLTTGENYQNHWVRGGCLLGYLPCNGLLYVAPHPCGCYLNAKLTGFNALAAAGSPVREIKTRLLQGPAYGHGEDASHTGTSSSRPEEVHGTHPTVADPGDEWPTYRHDGLRSGTTESPVDPNLQVLWQADIGTRPSAPTIAEGRVFVAGVDRHTVYALDAATGTRTWTCTAGARIDSPPTIHEGLALFGSADGRVYCVRTEDGALVWRFDAAPGRRLVTAFGQLESSWPVPGSVLIHKAGGTGAPPVSGTVCWFAAGRSSYLDGGLRLYGLEPASGKVLHEETLYSPDPQTGKMPPNPDGFATVGLLNDIPASDGTNVFIRQEKVFAADRRNRPHLFTSGGYLDPSWFNRTFWQVGRAQTSGLMVLGKDVAYGMEVYPAANRETVFKPGAGAYRLLCLSLQTPDKNADAKRRLPGARTLWQQHVDVRVTGLIRAADTIFAAGCPDVVDRADPYGAWEGRQGGRLVAFAAADGRKIADHNLPAPPVWDGLAAAYGRLFLSTQDGRVLCLGRRTEEHR
jgi:outer membrane protein assembly factor BamB